MSEGGLLWLGVGASACVHTAVAAGVLLIPHAGPSKTAVIDLTRSVRLVSPSRPALERLPAAPKPKPRPEPAWPKPGPKSPEPEPRAEPLPEPAPVPFDSAASAEPGAGDGSPAGGSTEQAGITAMPRLLNLRELAAVLRRSYPRGEKSAGRQGTVVLDLELDSEGRVTSAAVAGSSGPAFDSAALEVARLLRYAPARVGRLAVASKIRQPIAFKLGS
ncbi:MAG: TonB family protein [Elusimicrobiota bacterium]|jgi:TonB family protein